MPLFQTPPQLAPQPGATSPTPPPTTGAPSTSSQPMSISQFGDTIKQKYPQYQDMDSADLGQKMLTKYPQYQDMISQGAGAPTQNQPGFFSRLGSSLVHEPLGQGIIGAGKELGQLGTGLIQASSYIPGSPLYTANQMAKQAGAPTSGDIMNRISPALQTQGAAQKTGQLLTQTAELLTPTPEINAAKDAMAGVDIAGAASKVPGVGGLLEKGINAIKDIPALGKGLSYTTQKVLNALPEAAFGTAYGLSHGEKPGEAVKTGGVFGAFSAAGEVAGDIYRGVKGGIMKNIDKALGMTQRKVPLADVTKTVPRRLNAFQAMANLAGDIKVKTAEGVEKAWEPTKDGFYEGLQALQQSKQKIYSAYDELANKAGDAGAQFGEKDFKTVVDSLAAAQKNTTSAFVSKSKSLIEDLQRNYGTFNEDGEFTGWKNTSLSDIENFIKKVNVDVNPGSDKAGAEVSAAASASLRKQMEDKILNSTNQSWQAIRNTYRDLMTIEPEMMNQFRKVTRGSPGAIGKYVEGFGAIDTLLGFLEKNPLGVVKGAAMAGLGKTMNFLRDPTTGLQEAFSQIMKEDPGALEKRVVGSSTAPKKNPEVPGAPKLKKIKTPVK